MGGTEGVHTVGTSSSLISSQPIAQLWPCAQHSLPPAVKPESSPKWALEADRETLQALS